MHKAAIELFRQVKEGEFAFMYRGNITHGVSNSLLSLAEQNPNDTLAIRKKVYYIMMEGLQNLTRHQLPIYPLPAEQEEFFALEKHGERYHITIGNLVKTEDVAFLKEKLEHINGLNRNELKDYAMGILADGALSKKGGAGLGLIEMARRSGNRLTFDFHWIDDEHSYFYLNTRIGGETNNTDLLISHEAEMPEMRYLHKNANENSILLGFRGDFNQEVLLNLLSIIEASVGKSSVLNKLIGIMVEMLQNIVKHGEGENAIGKPGLFYVGVTEQSFVLTAGNYISKEDVPKLTSIIVHLNHLDRESLHQYHQQLLKSNEKVSQARSGLSLSKIRLRSNRNLEAFFYNIEEGKIFFTLSTEISR